MNGLLSPTPSPVAARLAVSAALLLLVQAFLVLQAPGTAAALRLMTWLVALVAGTALGFAMFGRWPAETRAWVSRHDW